MSKTQTDNDDPEFDYRNVIRFLAIVNHNLHTINGTMDYDRITDCIIRLAQEVIDTEHDESVWWIEDDYEGLDNLIVGAYWHFSEWGGGQYSKAYQALSVLGQLYTPSILGMADEDAESITYQQLNEMIEQTFKVRE